MDKGKEKGKESHEIFEQLTDVLLLANEQSL